MSTITITTKVRIYPTPEQEVSLKKTQHGYVDGCNLVSQWVKDHHELSQKKINSALYSTIRETTGLGAQMSQSVIKTVIGTYKTIHRNNKKWSVYPKYKKHRVDLVRGRDYSLSKDGRLSIGTIDGRIKVSYTDDPSLPLHDHALGTASLVHKHGKWIMHIPVTINIDEPSDSDIGNVMGIDVGLRFLATSYDSSEKTRFYPGGEVKRRRAHYKQLRSELQKKNTRSSRKRLKTIGNRENRWMTDVNHRVSKALVKSAGDIPTLFALEDLTGIRSATETVCKKNRYHQVSWAFYQLRSMIEYKAKKNGHASIAVDPRNTSRACPKCGFTSKKNRNSNKHLFTCRSCGYSSNDDRVGAMNIHSKGIKYRMDTTVQHAVQSQGASQPPLDVPPSQGGRDSYPVCTTGQGQTPTSKHTLVCVGGG